MNKGYGGTQPNMRSPTIEDETYLGSFEHPGRLNVGDVQIMQYLYADSGPFYLSNEEKHSKQFDTDSGEKEIKNTQSHN